MSAGTRARWSSRALSRTAIVGVTTSRGHCAVRDPRACSHHRHSRFGPGRVGVGTDLPRPERGGQRGHHQAGRADSHRSPGRPAPGQTGRGVDDLRSDHHPWPSRSSPMTGSSPRPSRRWIWSGGRIAPGQFQDFSVSADPLPQGVSQLAFKAIQTYSNGDVVRWIDVPQPRPARAGPSGASADPDFRHRGGTARRRHVSRRDNQVRGGQTGWPAGSRSEVS